MRWICLFLLLSFNTVSAQKINTYINTYKEHTVSLSNKFGIPTSIILATAIVESGAGTSKKAKLLNNHFGIVGKNNLKQHNPPIKTRYKQFASVEDSYTAFCELISHRNFYSALKGNMDYKQWISAISKSKYSTNPESWSNQIKSIIVKYKLYLLDTQ